MFRCFESPSPSRRLAKAIRGNDLETVKKILEADKELCNKYIPDEDMTPLQLACSVSFTDGGDCLKYLLTKCDPEDVNDSTGLNALHVAARYFYSNDSLSILLSSDAVNVNSLSKKGDSVLHTLVNVYKKGQGPEKLAQYSEKLNLLLRHKDLRVNHRNRQRLAAIHYAVEKKDKVTIKKMLTSAKSFDVDFKPEGKESPRVQIAKLFPDLEEFLPKEGNVDPDLESEMFEHLYLERWDKFVSSLDDIKDRNLVFNVNADDGYMSLMQTACYCGILSVVECLLKYNGDPNATSRFKRNELPVFLAAERRYPEVLRRLLKEPSTLLRANNGRTVLHALLDDSCGVTAINSGVFPLEERRRQCFDYLMKEDGQRLAINAQDLKQHDTALQMATYWGEVDFIIALLKKGAYIGENDSGVLPLNNVPMSIIQEFLDGCVTDNGKFPTHEDYEIYYDFTVLIPPSLLEKSDDGHVYPTLESRLLVAFSESDHLRPTLRHPVLLSYISLKWSSLVRSFFYINLICYTLHMLVVNAYILFPTSKTSDDGTAVKTLTLALYGMQFFVIVWELLLCVAWPSQYLKNLDSYLKILLIVFSFLLMTNRYSNQLAAVSILLSWIVLVLLLGTLPNLSVHLNMLKIVSKSFFQFFSFYSLILLAFALSFYTLSRNLNDETNLVHEIAFEIYKTVVMASGEYEEHKPKNVVSYLIFLAFIFFVVIIIFNLLNGLAVGDTQKIKDNAELVGLVAQTKMLYYVEKIYLQHPVWCKTPDRCCCCCGCLGWTRWLHQKISLLKKLDKNTKFHVKPNKGSGQTNKCHYRFDSHGCGKWSRNDLHIGEKVIKETINIILRRKNERNQKRNL